MREDGGLEVVIWPPSLLLVKDGSSQYFQEYRNEGLERLAIQIGATAGERFRSDEWGEFMGEFFVLDTSFPHCCHHAPPGLLKLQ